MSSSRIIVKNLPKVITKESLTEHFSKLGQVTDVRLVYSSTGVFRRFAFIGYLDDTQANKAVEYFNKSFIDSCKIEVEVAKPYSSTSDIPRNPWSRGRGHKVEVDQDPPTGEGEPPHGQQRLNQDHHKSKLAKYLGEMYELEDDPEFAEFLSLHKSTSVSKAWANDDTLLATAAVQKKQKRKLTEESAISQEDEKPKKKRKKEDTQGGEGTGDKGSVLSMGGDKQKGAMKKKKRETKIENIGNKKDEKKTNKTSSTRTPYTLKMRGVPFKSKPQAVHDFFHPLKLSDIRMVTDKDGKPTGVAYVDFHTEKDMLEGFKRDRDCIGRRYIELFKEETSTESKPQSVDKPRPWENKMADNEGEGVEPIAESGRLFIRNLSYSITEDDLTQLFEKYGPLTEVLLPLDKTTSKPIGLGFVTFMLPEHAVKAFSELDKQIFQGRLLHILPSKPPLAPSTKQVTSTSTSSYKKTKEQSMKETSTSAHNWNALFLGSNAVVDAMADRYDVDKSDLLDFEADQPLAVRLALGETQLVTETREFLEEQGVVLGAFDDAKPKRSKKIILVKNLAFGTTDTELNILFTASGGSPNRVILPPGGISALVEFSEASTAKKVFKKLAYTEFKDVPLYLEWAPIGVLRSPTETAAPETDTTTDVEPKSSKLLVRNVPFEAGKKEVMQLFGVIGKLKNVRLPKKMGSTNEHRGFCFVEYVTKEDAKRAMDTLGHSTHIYGRRLVLEWAELEENVSDIRQRTVRYFSTDHNPDNKRSLKKKLMSALEKNSEETYEK